MNRIRTALLYHPLIGYFILALGLSWLVEAPLVLRTQGVLGLPVSA